MNPAEDSVGVAGPDERGLRRPAARNIRDFFSAVLLAAAPFIAFILRDYLRLDLWFDELLSLEKFILVPLATTATDYSTTNNHVFFNLLMNLYLRAAGVRDLFALMSRPWVLRVVPLACSVVALPIIYATGRKFFGRFGGGCAAVILATTVPFFNFAVQVRGYALSIMLLCALVFLVWSLEERLSAAGMLGLAALSALLLYTVPVNLYVLVALALCECLLAGANLLFRKSNPLADSSLGGRRLTIAAGIAAGIAAAVLLYLPVLERVLHNPFVEPTREFRPMILTETLPTVMSSFVSGRWALLGATPFALAALLRARSEPEGRRRLERYLSLCWVLVLPFMISFLRRNRSYDRVFVNLAPIAALLLALNLDAALGMAGSRRRALALWAAPALWLYCTARFAGELERRDRHLVTKIEAPQFAHREQNLYYNYFQTRWRPRETARLVKNFQERLGRALPVMLPRQLPKGDFPREFLQAAGIAFEDLDGRPKGVPPYFDEAIFITTQPLAFERWLRWRCPDVQCNRLNAEVAYTNVFYCRRAAAGSSRSLAPVQSLPPDRT